jgi:predicted DNA-binding protein with PD1-like motif
MESGSFAATAVHVVRVDPGEDVLGAVEEFLAASGVRQAMVAGGYGTLAASHLHWVAHNRIPTDNIFRRDEGGIEILAMNGLVVEGAPHIHVALSTPDGAYGGHLEPGCIAYVLCEVFLLELDGPAMARRATHVSVEGMGEGQIPRLTFGENEATPPTR